MRVHNAGQCWTFVLGALFFWLLAGGAEAQILDTCGVSNAVKDSITIAAVEGVKGPEKVLHAEPLYIDLIRDLGARKGEAELNVAWGMTDMERYINYEALIEYEWAPMDRLGFEVEVPVSINADFRNLGPKDEIPPSSMEGLKLATQYSFYVSEKHQTSLAMGYIHTWKMPNYVGDWQRGFNSHQFNPFFVAARRWGSNFHTLLYTGPIWNRSLEGNWNYRYALNSNVHYMITGTRNFIGLEVNKEVIGSFWRVTARPQLRLGITDHLLIGIVSAIPIHEGPERFGSFFRVIWEPKR